METDAKLDFRTLKERVVDRTIDKIDDVEVLAQKNSHNIEKLDIEIEDIREKSIGVWISNHPFKFVVFLVILVGSLIENVRHPVIEFVKGLSKVFK